MTKLPPAVFPFGTEEKKIAKKIVINDTKLYVPVKPLSTQEDTKQLQHLILAFERAIKWNKYQLKLSKLRN